MKKLLPLFLFFFALNTFSQKEANFWYFGENAGLDFNSGIPVAVSDGKLNTLEGCSSISNSHGELLFYSDGTILYNKNHEIMTFTNGVLAQDLGGNPSSTQSALFVPNPVNENVYYLFTVGTDFVSNSDRANPGFNFYTITKDPAVKNGLGEITSGPINLAINPVNGENLSSLWSEKVTAVQGGCDSIWVLSAVGNKIYAYEISESGVDFNNPIISSLNYIPQDKRGYLKVSPDGKKIALADFNQSRNSIGNGSLVLFDFNDQNGIVSSDGIILTNSTIDGAPYGVEFSQQSNKLYASTFDDNNNKIFQFDLTQSNIAATKNLISTQVGFRSALQLAPDGKIYNSIPNNNFLGAIENPNDDAREVRYTENAISLGSARASQGLPPFIQSFFSPVNIVSSLDPTIVLSNEKVCIDEVLIIEPEIQETLGSTFQYFWTKKEDTSVDIRTRSFTIDNANYGTGTYKLEILSIDECGKDRRYNSEVEVEFIPLPSINTIPLYSQCDFDTITTDGITNFNLASIEIDISNESDVTIDFFEPTDISLSSPIIDKVGYRNTTSPFNHKLIVRVKNNNEGCFTTGEIQLEVNPTSLADYDDMYESELDANANTSDAINSNGTSNAIFDFEAKIDEIITKSNSAFNKNEFSFSFYTNRNDAEREINNIKPPFNDYTFTDNTIIFVRIAKGNRCAGVGRFTLFVQTRPIPQGNTAPIILCLSNPIDIPQPFTVDLNATTGVASDTYVWYRNNQIISGVNNSLYKANQEGIYKVEAYRNYVNDPVNSSDDFTTMGYNTFTVNESNKALIESIDFKDNQDNPDENTITIKISGKGTYEYALNSSDISSFSQGAENLSYTFTNVKPGLNTVYINDINGCGVSSSNQISFVFFQRFFTPNGDGKFDTWKIQGVDNSFYKVANLQVFDRYGKLIKTLDLKTENGWDGTFNGKFLPQNDYWYNAILIDINGKIRKKIGHFSLLKK